MEEQKIITLSDGFELSVDADAMDNLDIFECIKTSSDTTLPDFKRIDATFQAFRIIIGEDQDAALRKHLEEKEGKVKTSSYRVMAEECFSSFGDRSKK